MATGSTTTAPAATGTTIAPAGDATTADGADVLDLIEDVSIDGMCGVY
jgi:hypothetical protein